MTAAAVDTVVARMRRRGLACVVIGASAGGVEALVKLLPSLGDGRAFPVLVIVHLPPEEPNLLPDILGYHCRWPVREACQGETVAAGTVYIAPPGYHLYLERDHSFSFGLEAPVHFSRPSISVLIDSAAWVYRAELLAVLLTGANEDGADAMKAVQESGGFTVVQEPASADSPQMPQAALKLLEPDLVLELDEIARLLALLTSGDA